MYAALEQVADLGHDPLRVLAVATNHLPIPEPRQAYDPATLLHVRLRHWLDHAPPANSEDADAPVAVIDAHQPITRDYTAAVGEINQLIQNRLDALRQHPDDDEQRRRFLALAILDSTQGITPGPSEGIRRA